MFYLNYFKSIKESIDKQALEIDKLKNEAASLHRLLAFISDRNCNLYGIVDRVNEEFKEFKKQTECHHENLVFELK
ncbi:MAG: hypothetical protein SV375_20985, partial [Thermodesulfobacteriota bacterium]|nr:hypothetical protein [Thermodesulfobacteriota bacterium]